MTETSEDVSCYLPSSGYKILHAKLKGLNKRDPQLGGIDPTSITMVGGSLLAWLKSLAETFSPDKNAPRPTVPEMQDEKPQGWDWPGVKRTKVRYGPYRIAPTSVGYA
jgi:hypothetical protein